MADQFDSYREALVMETNTVWPVELGSHSAATRQKVEQALHAKPAEASALEYIRTHSGFCRTITVTQADLDRLA